MIQFRTSFFSLCSRILFFFTFTFQFGKATKPQRKGTASRADVEMGLFKQPRAFPFKVVRVKHASGCRRSCLRGFMTAVHRCPYPHRPGVAPQPMPSAPRAR